MEPLHYLLIAVFLFVSACATSSSYQILEESEAKRELIVPAGVDSLTAAESRELADSSFVSYQREQEAEEMKRRANAYRAESDTLWYYLSLDSDEGDQTVDSDDPEFVDAFNVGADSYIEARSINQQEQINQNDINRYSELVENAISAFERALRVNPFDTEVRLLLGELYGTKAIRLNREEEHEKAIDVLEKLVRIEKGEHVVYRLLADNYFSLNNYELAATNYKSAKTTLLETAPLTDSYMEYGGFTPNDSTSITDYLYFEALSYANLFDAEKALSLFNEAKSYAISDDDIAAINSQIDFINWDDGNILGSMRRDSLITLVNNGHLEQAESGYMELQRSLKTKKANDEIDWRLGVVQYQLGKEDEAADRLLSLIQRTEINQDGSPVDSLYVRYFNDFGVITYNIGVQYLNERNRNLALKYFNQSTKVKWDNRARSYLSIADLLSNNVTEAIYHAELAEEELDSLDEQNRIELYEMLMDLHRRNGNRDRAMYYRDQLSQL